MSVHETRAAQCLPSTPDDALARRLAHLAEERGTGALPELRRALSHPAPWIRLHAVEGLSGLTDPEAHAALATALHDPSFGVHWAASAALATAGRPGVTTVLRALLHDRSLSAGFLHGVAYVLRHAALTPSEQEAVAPVIATLDSPVADLEAPVAALAALDGLAPGTVSAAERKAPWYRITHARRSTGGHVFRPPVDQM